MSCLRCLICALAAAFAALNVYAQQITGSIRGNVSDPSGAVVQTATVIVKQAETGLTRTATSDHEGSYVLLELPIGHYSLEVSARGFRKYLQGGISLNVNETAIVPVRLAVGAETQRLEVTADAQLIQSTVSSLGVAVLERELLDLPLDGRNFSQLGLLQPGVVPLTAGLREAGGSLRDGQAYAVDGQRPESNNFLIDGANNVNAVDAGFVLKPPIDAISEFRILTHNANAEFGQNTGSTTNIITRSGSNLFHGAVWEFLRNDAMDASDFSAHTVQPLKQNQFGATFGGPIVKDKTFFFGYYEGFRNRQGETVNATVPSLLERQGIFLRSTSASSERATRLDRSDCSQHSQVLSVTEPGGKPAQHIHHHTVGERQQRSIWFEIRSLSFEVRFAELPLPVQRWSDERPALDLGCECSRFPGGRRRPCPKLRRTRDPRFFARDRGGRSLFLLAEQVSF
jgi:hypothetical protein